jgi:hypothetical protein
MRTTEHHPPFTTISLGEWMAMKTEVNDLKRMVRRLTLKLERLDGASLATQDARRLFDFDTAPRSQIEITEAGEDLENGN